MEFFMRMKQEAEGWLKLSPEILESNGMTEMNVDDLVKEAICDLIEELNGGMARPRKEKVTKNPVKRQLAKIFLNCLWGKLCQKPPKEFETFIYGYQQYLEICSNIAIDQTSLNFRHVNGDTFKVRYKCTDQLTETNRIINVYIAASVTAHAQVHLMRQMFRIGPDRILYCDTDSIMFLRKRGEAILEKQGLGNWQNEHPREVLLRFWAIAPKCYLMESADVEEVHKEYDFKCKGVRNSAENREVTKWQSIHELIEATFLRSVKKPLEAKTMVIHPNSTNSLIAYGTMCTRRGTKQIDVVYSKRNLGYNDENLITKMDQMAVVRTFPKGGYTGNIKNVKRGELI